MSLSLKFFAEAKFCRQKTEMDEKNSFGELSTEEIQEIVDDAVPVRTKKPQRSGWNYVTVHISSFP